MRDFFKPWRRKLGVVTLLLACVFAAGWVRSLSKADFLVFPGKMNANESRVFYESPSLISANGCLVWANSRYEYVKGGLAEDWVAERYPSWFTYPDSSRFFAAELLWISSRVEESSNLSRVPRAKFVIIPFWVIALPLTLLAVYLLVSKPRPAPKPATEPAPTTGA